MASGNTKEKKLAREMQERTGLSYTECLRRVRSEHAETKKEEPVEKNSTMEKDAKCACGQALPWHLFKLEVGVKHICSCERTYVEQAGVVHFVGTENNPFTKKQEW